MNDRKYSMEASIHDASDVRIVVKAPSFGEAIGIATETGDTNLAFVIVITSEEAHLEPEERTERIDTFVIESRNMPDILESLIHSMGQAGLIEIERPDTEEPGS